MVTQTFVDRSHGRTKNDVILFSRKDALRIVLESVEISFRASVLDPWETVTGVEGGQLGELEQI